MEELLRTNDPALLSFVESLLRDEEIEYFIADQTIRTTEGSMDIFPYRVLIPANDFARARVLLIDAGLESELRLLRREPREN
ncbi:MAG: DUF2007 domain-containing protein [Marinicaulis sp.]|nr:DUF2007 domain-containing protein [Marinicaulis sp.]